MQSIYLNARETAERLGIKRDTLYAYVSRGLLRSVVVPGSRERGYRADDVERLRAGRGSSRAARSEPLIPVIDSSICLIERCQVRLANLAAEDLVALDLTPAGIARTGRTILYELAACVGETRLASEPVHRRLATLWRLDAAGGDIVRRCLVLLADHELNASTFVARCVASTGATPYAVVSGALSALSGRRHGGASARAEALFHEISQRGDPMTVMAARLARDEHLPGLGHPLYPEGDPRAEALLAAAMAATPASRPLIEA